MAGEREIQQRKPIPVLEWIVAGVGLAMVVCIAGYLLFEAAAREEGPPEIIVRVDSIVGIGGQYLVALEIVNRGGETVAGLTVEGELSADTGKVESNEITIPYAPSRSARKAGIFFTHDPRQFKLELIPKGYHEP